jgi:hypothetical protein
MYTQRAAYSRCYCRKNEHNRKPEKHRTTAGLPLTLPHADVGFLICAAVSLASSSFSSTSARPHEQFLHAFFVGAQLSATATPNICITSAFQLSIHPTSFFFLNISLPESLTLDRGDERTEISYLASKLNYRYPNLNPHQATQVPSNLPPLGDHPHQ